MTIYSSAARVGEIRIIVTGGGTGGHTYPALTTIRTIRDRLARAGVSPEILWVGVSHGLEAKISVQNNIPFKAITTGKLRRHLNIKDQLRNVADAFRIPYGVFQAIVAVARNKPDVVISTGGYVCVPVGVAAWLLRRPLVMHEQTLAVGLANRILARLATKILLSHESSLEHLPPSARKRAVVTGNPIRPEVLQGHRDSAISAYGLDPRLPLVYVTGGAQGALQVNKMVAEVLPDLLTRAQVLHQCGDHSYEMMRERHAALPPHLQRRYTVFPYIHGELPDVLAAADVVVARSGAGTVAELCALGKACVYVPLIPTQGDEQRRTARHLAADGAARMLAAEDATPERLRQELTALLDDPHYRQQIAEAARKHGHPEASSVVADEVLAAAHRA
jgi:UDP-N-acetylglucosamine--N-acetylmuramyl-(pentapeptide) pyrophosphoryl-undecaprenol N-acetylglucosamine transferase